jgi:hypothetical protein
MEEIKQVLEQKRASLITEIELDEKYCDDRINGRFYQGRVAVETKFKEFIEELMNMLN